MSDTVSDDEPIYSRRQLAKFERLTRHYTRRNIRKIWVWTMVITVAVAACVRRQKFVPDLDWYWVPIIAVAVNAICWWLAIRAYWGNPK